MDHDDKIRVEENLKLVWHCTKDFYPPHGMDEDDLFQIGCIGLIHASVKFDESKGCRFSTFASICIKNEIRMAIRRTQRKTAIDPWMVDPLDMRAFDEGDMTLQEKLPSHENIENEIISDELYEFMKKKDVMVTMMYAKGYQRKEVAEAMGIKPITVSRRLGNLKKHLIFYDKELTLNG